MTQAPPETREQQTWDVEPVPDDGADRGRLSIDRSALRRIAEHAADLVPGSARVDRRVAGVRVGAQGANAQLAGPDRELRVRLDVALHYPSSVPEAVSRMREDVTAELERQAGCRVRSVDVTVSALVSAAEPPRVE